MTQSQGVTDVIQYIVSEILTTMDPLLLSLFENTKLNEKQRRVYLALLQLGQATISQVASVAELKRPNTYSIIAELEALGYAHEVIGKSKKTYAATDPNTIASELKRASKSFEEMLPYLRAIQNRKNKPYAQYFSGKEGVTQAFKQIYRPKDARYLTSIARDSVIMPDEVARWQKSYILGVARPGSKHILTDTVSDRAFAQTLDEAKQLTRFLDPAVKLNVDIVLVDGMVFLTSFEDGINVTVIKSRAIYEAFCTMYDLSWEQIGDNS